MLWPELPSQEIHRLQECRVTQNTSNGGAFDREQKVRNLLVRIDGKQLCGFNYGGVITEEIIEIKDKEGINMHDQFLSLKKSRNQAIGETDQQQDEVIDVRDFYSCSTEEEDHYHEAFVLKHKNKTENKVEN